MYFGHFIFVIVASITTVIHGQSFPFNTFTHSPIIANMDLSTCGNTYQGATTTTQRWESYSFTSVSTFQSITFSTCGSTFDTTLQLYYYDDNWIPSAFADDQGSCTPQTELILSNLAAGDYVLELTSYENRTWGDYDLTSHSCVIGTPGPTLNPSATTTTPPTWPSVITTATPSTTTPQPSVPTPSPISSNGDSSQEESSGVSSDLLTQICIAILVYAFIPCIFYCMQTYFCSKEEAEKEEEKEDTTDNNDDESIPKSPPSIIKAYILAMIDIFDCTTDIISGYNFFFINGCGILDCQSENLSTFIPYGVIFILCGSIGAIMTILKNILLYYQIKNLNNTDPTISMKMKILNEKVEAIKILIEDIPIALCFIVLLMVHQYDLSFAMKISLTITFFDLLVLAMFYCREHRKEVQERKPRPGFDQHGRTVDLDNIGAAGVMRPQMCNRRRRSYLMYFCLILTVFILGLELAFAWFGIVSALSPKMLTINGECYAEGSLMFDEYDYNGYTLEASWISDNFEFEITTSMDTTLSACVGTTELDYGECTTVGTSACLTTSMEICVDRCTLDN